MLQIEKILCGNITLFRAMCPECHEFNLSGTSKFSCDCGNVYDINSVTNVRILAKRKRMNCPVSIRKKLLVLQNNKCFYCGREFGTIFYKNHRTSTLTAHADHMNPYSFTQNNADNNWTLACSICNRWKHNKVFEDINDCKKFLLYRWDKELSQGKICLE